MNRPYAVCLEISGVNPAKKDDVIGACCRETQDLKPWDFWMPETERDSIGVLVPKKLCEPDRVEQLTDRLARAAWTANGAFCRLMLCEVWLNEVPFVVRGVEEYRTWMKEGGD